MLVWELPVKGFSQMGIIEFKSWDFINRISSPRTCLCKGLMEHCKKIFVIYQSLFQSFLGKQWLDERKEGYRVHCLRSHPTDLLCNLSSFSRIFSFFLWLDNIFKTCSNPQERRSFNCCSWRLCTYSVVASTSLNALFSPLLDNQQNNLNEEICWQFT